MIAADREGQGRLSEHGCKTQMHMGHYEGESLWERGLRVEYPGDIGAQSPAYK
jgi:hypothetical protein